MPKRLLAITLILIFSLLASGCWQVFAARRAAKRVEDGNGPVASAYDSLTEENNSSE